MGKLIKFFAACLMSAVLMVSLTVAASAATPATKKWIDPYDDPSFPKAESIEMKLPANYDANPSKSQVFSLNQDAGALAALYNNKTAALFKEVLGSMNRKSSLMKDYVAVDYSLIYHFENGFKDFEFMGIAGAGNWAGMFGMDNTILFSYSASAAGPWTDFKTKDIKNIASEESTRGYFSSSVPTSARYLKIEFLEGQDYEAVATGQMQANGKPQFHNWECALGYLLVNEYTSAPSSNASQSGTVSSVNNNNTATVSQNKTSSTAANTESVTSVTDDNSSLTSSVSDETASEEETASESNDTATGTTHTVTRVNWPAVIGLAAAVVLVLAGASAFFVIKAKKNKSGREDGVTVDKPENKQ